MFLFHNSIIDTSEIDRFIGDIFPFSGIKLLETAHPLSNAVGTQRFLKKFLHELKSFKHLKFDEVFNRHDINSIIGTNTIFPAYTIKDVHNDYDPINKTFNVFIPIDIIDTMLAFRTIYILMILDISRKYHEIMENPQYNQTYAELPSDIMVKYIERYSEMYTTIYDKIMCIIRDVDNYMYNFDGYFALEEFVHNIIGYSTIMKIMHITFKVIPRNSVYTNLYLRDIPAVFYHAYRYAHKDLSLHIIKTLRKNMCKFIELKCEVLKY